MRRIFALIPAHNEATRIAEVVTGALKYLPVILVDDGSSDDTAGQARRAGAIVIRQTPNQGKGQALRVGFKYALDRGANAVLTLDGDGQHDPEEIPLFLSSYKTQAQDLLIGKRDFKHMPASRRLANTLGRWIISLAVGQDIPDNQSGYRLISARLMKRMLPTREEGFEFEVEMLILAIKHQFTIDWVPIRTIYIGGTSHIQPVEHIRNFIRVSFKAWQTIHSKGATIR